MSHPNTGKWRRTVGEIEHNCSKGEITVSWMQDEGKVLSVCRERAYQGKGVDGTNAKDI